MPAIRRRITVITIVALLLVVCGCGPSPPDAPTLLKQAKSTIDQTGSLHFTLTSENVQGKGILLTGAEGNFKRPDGFAGTLAVRTGSLPLTVSIVSVRAKFYAKLPFHPSYEVASPAQYGFGDPALLLDRNTGLSSLLAQARNPQDGDSSRRNGEQLQEVRCTLPGARVGTLLTSADPSRDVQAVFRINLESNQTREVVLTGPFFQKDNDSTFHLILDMYGENVSVTAPPTP